MDDTKQNENSEQTPKNDQQPENGHSTPDSSTQSSDQQTYPKEFMDLQDQRKRSRQIDTVSAFALIFSISPLKETEICLISIKQIFTMIDYPGYAEYFILEKMILSTGIMIKY